MSIGMSIFLRGLIIPLALCFPRTVFASICKYLQVLGTVFANSSKFLYDTADKKESRLDFTGN